MTVRNCFSNGKIGLQHSRQCNKTNDTLNKPVEKVGGGICGHNQDSGAEFSSLSCRINKSFWLLEKHPEDLTLRSEVVVWFHVDDRDPEVKVKTN